MSRRELPAGWVQQKLRDLGTWRGGGTPTKSEPAYWENGNIPWVSPKDMKRAVIDDAEDHITEAAVENSACNLVPAGSVLMVTRSGILAHSFPVATTIRPVTINQDMKALTPASGIVPEYLRLALTAGKQSILQECSKAGTTVASISSEKLSDFEVSIPPSDEQRRIVEKIEALTVRSRRAREALDSLPVMIDRCRQSILAAAFSGNLTVSWRRASPLIESREDMLGRVEMERKDLFEGFRGNRSYMPAEKLDVSDDLPVLPPSWQWVSAEQICGFITKGTTPSRDKMSAEVGGVPYIKVYNLTFFGDLDFSVDPTFVPAEVHSGELARSKVLPGDVLMNIVGPPLGKVSIVPDSFPEWNINQAIAVFRCVPSLMKRFLMYYFLSNGLLFRANLLSKATAGQQNLTLEICRKLPVPLPPVAEQREIVNRIDKAFSAIEAVHTNVKIANSRLTTLDQSILAKAFRGQLVPQDPNDEPASVLLERIRAERAAGGVPSRRGRRKA
ncbi:hypothetical protein CRT60_31225 [Azospirillum palustre]|uniref:Type I restriction modification DNA specificity domain-containing protein n=1 Tax=Azospirillum palustre TaxID=2044885 RepID=A0A2B8B8K4_9PROT|nr:restriction endonuclease subunit S [Azospirillum palustre]PGH54275.1 hypothetical protein CRT60_31225 [Azospirillum palustre]